MPRSCALRNGVPTITYSRINKTGRWGIEMGYLCFHRAVVRRVDLHRADECFAGYAVYERVYELEWDFEAQSLLGDVSSLKIGGRALTWATVMTSVMTSRDRASASEEDVNHSRVLVLVSAVKLFHAQFLTTRS